MCWAVMSITLVEAFQSKRSVRVGLNPRQLYSASPEFAKNNHSGTVTGVLAIVLLI